MVLSKCDKGGGGSKIGGRPVTYFLNAPLCHMRSRIIFSLILIHSKKVSGLPHIHVSLNTVHVHISWNMYEISNNIVEMGHR